MKKILLIGICILSLFLLSCSPGKAIAGQAIAEGELVELTANCIGDSCTLWITSLPVDGVSSVSFSIVSEHVPIVFVDGLGSDSVDSYAVTSDSVIVEPIEIGSFTKIANPLVVEVSSALLGDGSVVEDTAKFNFILNEETNILPVAVISTDLVEGPAPLLVNFASESTDEDGVIDSVQWILDGELLSNENEYSHEFTEPGDYEISLAVLDDQEGADTTPLNILVTGLSELTIIDHKRFTRWVNPDDGIVVWDRDTYGVESEDLFGYRDLVGRDVDNGYEDIALLDENGDGMVNSDDPDFDKLRIWQDMNLDGVSQSVELFDLSELSILSLDVSYRDTGEDVLVHSGSYGDGLLSAGVSFPWKDESGGIRPAIGGILVLDLDGDGVEYLDCVDVVDGVCEVITLCGNGVLDGDEWCDSDVLECETRFSGYYGEKVCNDECSGYGVCESADFCGDGIVNGPEQCDNDDLFTRGLCVESGVEGDECKYITLSSDNFLSRTKCALGDTGSCSGEVVLSDIGDQKNKIENLFYMFLRGVELTSRDE